MLTPKTLTALAGFILVVAGMGLFVAQHVWTDHFLYVSKDFEGLGIQLHTSEVGFGVVVVGAILLIVATLGKIPGTRDSK
jgi:hypothetical protein